MNSQKKGKNKLPSPILTASRKDEMSGNKVNKKYGNSLSRNPEYLVRDAKNQ